MDRRKQKIILLVLFLTVLSVWLGQMPVRRMLNYLKDIDYEIDQRRIQLHQDNQEIQDNAQYVKDWNYIEDCLKALTLV